MTDEELISILVDTEAGLGPMDGYGPALDYVRALMAERDRLGGIIVEIYGKISYTGVFSPYSVIDECDLMPSAIGQIIAERDRLRAVIQDWLAVVDSPAPTAADIERAGGDAASTFQRALSLLGRQVKVTLARGDSPVIAVGQLVRVANSGEIVVLDDMGFCSYCWPMLDIEANESSAEGAPHESDGDGTPLPLRTRPAEEAAGALPDRPLTFSERVRAFKEHLPPGDDAAQIVAAKAEGLRYQPPICHTCGRAQELIRRFNSGNPMIHYEAMCGCDDEQQNEDVQAGLLSGRESDPADLVEGDAAGDEGGVGERRDPGGGASPARGEVGPGVVRDRSLCQFCGSPLTDARPHRPSCPMIEFWPGGAP